MQANAAQRYIESDVRPPDPREVNWKAKPLPFKIYRNCEQIPLSHDTATVGTGLAPVRREIGQMLIDLYGLTRQCHSVAIFHPMLKYLPREETDTLPFYTSLLRPVPSGGALFPCELYLLVRPGQHVPAGVYHYDVAHHALDILAQGDSTSLLQTALAHLADTPPAYTLLLSSYFWKDGFKYGAFSYRLQGLDIGTIISQSEIIAHHVGLSTTIHYQFQDKALNDLLGLDPLYESVYAVIEWRPIPVGITNNGQQGNEKPLSLLPTTFSSVHTRTGKSPATVATPQEPTTSKIPTPRTAPGTISTGTINASALETNGIPFEPLTESIARWPLLAEVHRASLIETREAFRPLHSLAPIQIPRRGEDLSVDEAGNVCEASPPLRFGIVPVDTPNCSRLASPLPETYLLPAADTPLDLWEARSKRCSAAGTFLPIPLSKQQLSQLLRTSMHGTTNDLDGHTDFLQHTLLYCAVHRVQGVPAGIYRYEPERHALALVRAGDLSLELYQVLSMPNPSLFYMSVNLFPVGNYQSGIQIYGDRWYRMQNMEAGIIAQRLYLASATLKLGCRVSLGFGVPQANRFLSLPHAKDDSRHDQYTSLMQIMIARESSAYQYYEQSLLI